MLNYGERFSSAAAHHSLEFNQTVELFGLGSILATLLTTGADTSSAGQVDNHNP